VRQARKSEEVKDDDMQWRISKKDEVVDVGKRE